MVAVASAFQGVNADYGIAIDENGPKLPAIQATTYQPRTMSENVSLCLSEESFDMLDTEQGSKLGCTPEVCNFGGEEDVTMWALPKECRFVVMGIPRLCLYDKVEKTFHVWEKGQKLKGTNFVTAARLTLAMVKPDGELLMDSDGKPQLFTLKLTSNKTSLINGDRNDPEFKTLQDLNEGLQKHFGKRGFSLTHLVSVGLKASPKKFNSSTTAESSVGIMFALDAGAKPLPESSQLAVFNLIKDPEIQELIYDSFRLKSRSTSGGSGLAGDEDDDNETPKYDDIPF